MKNISLVVAGLALLASTYSFAGDAAAGKAKSAQCAACHGASGLSPMGMYPNLAQQKEQYLVKQLKDFRSGTRNDPTMKAMAAALTDADIANLSAYYASIK